MALVKPLVLGANGQITQIQAGDVLNAPSTEVDIISLVNGEVSSVSAGQAVYKSNTGNTFLLAQANGQATSKVIGIVKDTTIAPGAAGYIQTDGVVSGMSGLTIGSTYFLSPTTAGLLTTTAPSAAGQLIAKVGIAVSATELEITIDPTIFL